MTRRGGTPCARTLRFVISRRSHRWYRRRHYRADTNPDAQWPVDGSQFAKSHGKTSFLPSADTNPAQWPVDGSQFAKSQGKTSFLPREKELVNPLSQSLANDASEDTSAPKKFESFRFPSASLVFILLLSTEICKPAFSTSRWEEICKPAFSLFSRWEEMCNVHNQRATIISKATPKANTNHQTNDYGQDQQPQSTPSTRR